jgi:hypothetical protein
LIWRLLIFQLPLISPVNFALLHAARREGGLAHFHRLPDCRDYGNAAGWDPPVVERFEDFHQAVQMPHANISVNPHCRWTYFGSEMSQVVFHSINLRQLGDVLHFSSPPSSAFPILPSLSEYVDKKS